MTRELARDAAMLSEKAPPLPECIRMSVIIMTRLMHHTMKIAF